MSDINVITVDGIEYVPRTDKHKDSPIRIVVLQRGWVVVGRYLEDGERVHIDGAKIIRKWGTTAGLGELVDGPLGGTILDPAGSVEAHVLGVVLTLAASVNGWTPHLS